MLGAEIGDERQQDHDENLRLRWHAADAVEQLQRLGGDKQRRDTGQDAGGDGVEEAERGSREGEAAGQCRRHRKAEHDQARRVVEQRLALQYVHQPGRNHIPVDDRGHRHGVGRRQHGSQRECDDERNARHQPMQGIAEADNGEEDEPDGEIEYGSAQGDEFALGRREGVAEQERRDEHQQKKLRIYLDMQALGRPGKGRADGDLQHRQRHPNQPDERARQRNEDEHDENEDGDVHGTIPAVCRPSPIA